MQFSIHHPHTPRFWMLAFLALSIILMAASTHLALQGKVTGLLFGADGEQLVVLQANATTSATVLALGRSPSALLPVDGLAILEEPDVLETYHDYNRFLHQQNRISGELAGDTLWLQLADGSQQAYALRDRTLADLRFGFYLQQLSGLLCLLIGGAIWAFNTRRTESGIYLLMGAGIALSCWSSAVYTSRELAIDGNLFRLLSLVNHFGAAAFGGGLLGLFAVYPRPLAGPLTTWLLTLSFLAVWLADSLQLTETIASAFHLPLLVYVLLAFALAFVQWRKTHTRPADRAILKWLLLSVMGTTMIFTVMNIIPAAFMATTLGAQAFTLAGFSLGFVMMALGLSRYKLFNLDRWWFQYWTWFFAGIAVLVVDWALLATLHVSEGPALGIAVALVGWLYMPVRRLIWRWLSPDADSSLQALLPGMVKRLFATRNQSDMHQAWGLILKEAFRPLDIHNVAALNTVTLADNGQLLRVPSLSGEPAWELAHAANGSRLFSGEDIELARMMLELVEKARQAMQAREEGMLAERGRIQRDLHDDLGARLLAVMHGASLEQSQQQARQAMTELRSILNALEQQPCPLEEAFAVWHSELEERILQAGFDMQWQEDFRGTTQLTARSRHNLGRVLRELVSNALRHSGGSMISLSVSFDGQQLLIRLADNGTQFDPSAAGGLGRKIVQSRIEELGGRVSWQTGNLGACQVDIQLAP